VRWLPTTSIGISGRLYMLSAIALVAVAALAASSMHFSRLTSTAAQTLSRSGLAGIARATELELLVEKHKSAVEAASKDRDAQRVAALRQSAHGIGTELRSLAAKQDRGEQASPAFALLPELTAKADLVLELASLLLTERARVATFGYVATSTTMQEHIRQERADHVTVASTQLELLRENARALTRWVVASALIALFLIGPISIALMRSVILRLHDITHGMMQLAANDTTLQITGTQAPDEIGSMARALEVFKANAISLLDHQSKLESVNVWLDVALNNMSRGVSMFDANNTLVLCNANYARLYGLPAHLTQSGTPIAAIIAHRVQSGMVIEAPKTLESHSEGASFEDFIAPRTETNFIQRSREGRLISVSNQPLSAGGWVALHQDVTKQREADDVARRLARQDALTTLQNRRGLQEALGDACRRIATDGGFAVHCIDLDKFKHVNDAHGHQAGDTLLEAVAQRLRKATRPDDVVARLGGDEFAVIQCGTDCRETAQVLGARLVDVISKPYQIRGHVVTIGASIGIALAPEHGDDPEELLRHADIALYAAKADGRRTHVTFEPAMDSQIQARRQLERDVRQALAYSEMTLHYQPILDLATQRVVSCEALMRWTHRERGFVSPADFIPIAEETGVIHELGAWALAEATRAAAAWPDGIKVSVNLSPAQFNGPDLAAIVAAALADSGLTPSRLTLEITESVLLKDDDVSMAMLHRLRDLGVSIALDDFGTGYSSLSYLRSFPFSQLKIDQSFVRDLPNRSECVAIVQAVTSLARSLDMTTVAEGVETNDHLQRVRAAGCDQAQGYLFSKPVPVERIPAIIEECQRRALFAA
jgi:diguanylate cyclase (GGDEF)-like protein